MTDALHIEILFNSVELELARRWVFGNVPTAFTIRPVLHLRAVLRQWWELYHESLCATWGRNRTIWKRNPAYPANALETPELVASLYQIRDLIRLRALRSYRSLTEIEEVSLYLLAALTVYYSRPAPCP
jgi:hypothetical protein